MSSISFSGDFVLEKIIDEEGELSGQLLDLKTDEPLKNAKISLKPSDIETYSDEDGYYSIDIPVGEWVLVISAEGYKDTIYYIVAEETESGEIEVSLTPADGNIIRGIVRDSITESPVGFAAVQVPELDIGAFTDVKGMFILYSVPTGVWDVRAELVGYEINTVEDVEVVEGEITDIEIYLVSTAAEGYHLQLGPNTDDIERNTKRLDYEEDD
jgi:hypothetical protein